ncbi:MAG: cytochrome c biogenesis protein ResB [Acidobacteria bacterium]|nr:cytochrome c biogenesis protein ResB [Acidobacteriota bacterium]
MSAIQETNLRPTGGTTASGDSPTTTERVVIASIGAIIAFLPLLIDNVLQSGLREAFGPDATGSGFYSRTFTVVVLLATAAVCGLGAKRTLDLLSSVRFGVSLLVLLAVACMVGMIVVQQNVDGFDKYFASLTPAQKFLYGKLGFFDIYHAWYFNALLLVLSLNIVLASIDRFPSAWTYVSRKKLDASAHWLRGQEQSATLGHQAESRDEVVGRVEAAFRSSRLKTRVTEKSGKVFVFGERAVWNRLGAYAVHVSLLTIFFGGFLTSMFTVGGQMPLEPGLTSNELTETVFDVDQLSRSVRQLPFTVECTDIEQKLIRKDGRITSDNTLDWLTRIKIKDPERGETEALVHLNSPFDYRGYRFFQASFVPNGKAREIRLRVTPEGGGQPQDLTITRGGAAVLPDGTRVEFKDFAANFKVGGGRQDESGEGEYNLPAATLAVTPPGARAVKAVAFTPEMAEQAPFARQPVAGHTWRLVDFEKAPQAHILAIQKDPGATVVYVGFTMLGLALMGVFFFSHDRVWALVEEKGEGRFEVVAGGNTNRNHLGFGDRFRKLVAAIGGEPVEVKKA